MSNPSKPRPASPPPAAAPPPPTAIQSVEAEEALLGALLITPDAISEIADFLKPDDFFIERNKWVWQAMIDIVGRNHQVDYVTVVSDLRDKDLLEKTGGESYITRLLNSVASLSHAETYAHLIQRASGRRRILDSASKMAQLAYDGEKDFFEVAALAQDALDAAIARSIPDRLATAEQAASTYLDILLAAQPAPTLKTGFADLDTLIGGLRAGDLMVVAGRPGMGKTSFLLSLLLGVARKIKADTTGHYVFHASMEMDTSQLIQRAVAMSGSATVKDQRESNLDEKLTAVLSSVVEISHLPVVFDDRSAMTPKQLRASCKRAMRLCGPLDLVIVDYAQLMTVEPEIAKRLNLNNDVAKHSYISRSLKELARDLNVPVLVAAQLNREVEKRRDKRPKMSDLRDSGSYEQDADYVALLYRDEVYNESTLSVNEAELNIAKSRHTGTGVVKLYFNKERSLFGNLQRPTYQLNVDSIIPDKPKPWRAWQSSVKDSPDD